MLPAGLSSNQFKIKPHQFKKKQSFGTCAGLVLSVQHGGSSRGRGEKRVSIKKGWWVIYFFIISCQYHKGVSFPRIWVSQSIGFSIDNTQFWMIWGYPPHLRKFSYVQFWEYQYWCLIAFEMTILLKNTTFIWGNSTSEDFHMANLRCHAKIVFLGGLETYSHLQRKHEVLG